MAKRRAAFLLKQQRKAEETRLRKQQLEAESELKRDEARYACHLSPGIREKVGVVDKVHLSVMLVFKAQGRGRPHPQGRGKSTEGTYQTGIPAKEAASADGGAGTGQASPTGEIWQEQAQITAPSRVQQPYQGIHHT